MSLLSAYNSSRPQINRYVQTLLYLPLSMNASQQNPISCQSERDCAAVNNALALGILAIRKHVVGRAAMLSLTQGSAVPKIDPPIHQTVPN